MTYGQIPTIFPSGSRQLPHNFSVNRRSRIRKTAAVIGSKSPKLRDFAGKINFFCIFFLIGTRFVPFLYYFCGPKAKLLAFTHIFMAKFFYGASLEVK
jgi:hypothetical protein